MQASAVLHRLEKVPTGAGHLLADYFELRALISTDGEYGFGDLSSAVARQQDIGRAGSATLDDLVATEAGGDGEPSITDLLKNDDEGAAPVEGDQLARERAQEGEEDAEDDEGSPEEEAKARERLAAELRAEIEPELRPLIESRMTRFGEAYPFVLDGDVLRLKEDLTRSRLLYLFLLIASCFRNLKRGEDRKTTTDRFELLAVPVLEAYFGPRLEAHVFGTAAAQGERYHGDVREAVDLLVRDTKFALGKNWEENVERLSASGDRGLDVVGWIPCFDDDPADLTFAVFGQCATGRNWEGKQFEASAALWGRIVHFTGPLTSVLLISFSYRRADGSWHDTTKFATTNVVFDRNRIIALLDPDAIDFPAELVEMIRDLEDADEL